MSHVWCSGDCCGSRHPRGKMKKSTAMAQKIARYHEVTNLAIVAAFSEAFGGFNTPRTCLSRSVAAVLDLGWGLGE